MKPTQSKPSIVFAHGIWADGSRFSKVATLLITATLLLGSIQKVVAAPPTGSQFGTQQLVTNKSLLWKPFWCEGFDFENKLVRVDLY